MKKILYLGVGLVLCMGAALFTGCEDEPSDNGTTSVVRGGIEGVVTDKASGASVSQALVELLSTDKKTQTDSKGAFSFADLVAGTYQLRVSKTGYETYTGGDLTVTDGRTLEQSVALMATDNPDESEPGPVGEGYEETAFGMSLQMVAVQGGTFTMGATSEQGDEYDSDERPVHSVTLDGFYIGQFEVTQSQWEAVMGTNPFSGSSYGVGDNYPVYYVSWNDAVKFCEKLSAQTGKKYRLPTEAEWEYAARGGQQADGTKYAGRNSVDEVAWYDCNSGSKTHPVGAKQPNALGLYDMSGNVWEWCQDWYGSYSSSPSVNPQGPAKGSYRVYRGGSWFYNAWSCRVSFRNNYAPAYRGNNLGFRVVCER